MAAVPSPPAIPDGGGPVPSPPDELGPTGARFWTAIMSIASGAYTTTDRVALLDWCKLRDLEADLESDVDEHGRMIMGSQGQLVLNPALRHLSDIRKDIRSAGKDLALNPRDRMALSILAEQSEDALDALIRRRASGE